MKQLFIKQIDAYLQANETIWTRKDVAFFASQYTQLCNFTNNLFTSFKSVKICLVNDVLIFRYYNSSKGIYGTAKVALSDTMQSVLLPAIKDVMSKYRHSIATPNQYQLAA